MALLLAGAIGISTKDTSAFNIGDIFSAPVNLGLEGGRKIGNAIADSPIGDLVNKAKDVVTGKEPKTRTKLYPDYSIPRTGKFLEPVETPVCNNTIFDGAAKYAGRGLNAAVNLNPVSNFVMAGGDPNKFMENLNEGLAQTDDLLGETANLVGDTTEALLKNNPSWLLLDALPAGGLKDFANSVKDKTVSVGRAMTSGLVTSVKDDFAEVTKDAVGLLSKITDPEDFFEEFGKLNEKWNPSVTIGAAATRIANGESVEDALNNAAGKLLRQADFASRYIIAMPGSGPGVLLKYGKQLKGLQSAGKLTKSSAIATAKALPRSILNSKLHTSQTLVKGLIMKQVLGTVGKLGTELVNAAGTLAEKKATAIMIASVIAKVKAGAASSDGTSPSSSLTVADDFPICHPFHQDTELRPMAAEFMGNDSGSDGTNNMNHWRPNTLGNQDCITFGDIITKDSKEPTLQALCGKNNNNAVQLGKGDWWTYPVDYEPVWNSSCAGDDFVEGRSIWVPVCQPGYSSTGIVVGEEGSRKPTQDRIACLKQDPEILSMSDGNGAGLKWETNDQGSGAKAGDVTIYNRVFNGVPQSWADSGVGYPDPEDQAKLAEFMVPTAVGAPGICRSNQCGAGEVMEMGVCKSRNAVSGMPALPGQCPADSVVTTIRQELVCVRKSPPVNMAGSILPPKTGVPPQNQCLMPVPPPIVTTSYEFPPVSMTTNIAYNPPVDRTVVVGDPPMEPAAPPQLPSPKTTGDPQLSTPDDETVVTLPNADPVLPPKGTPAPKQKTFSVVRFDPPEKTAPDPQKNTSASNEPCAEGENCPGSGTATPPDASNGGGNTSETDTPNTDTANLSKPVPPAAPVRPPVGTPAPQQNTFAVVRHMPQTVIVILDGELANGTENEPYEPQALIASGGAAPYEIEIAGDFPPGLDATFFNDTTLALTGTPEQPGTYPIKATATDANGVSSPEQSYIIEVAPSVCLPGMWIAPDSDSDECQCRPGLQPVAEGNEGGGNGCRAPPPVAALSCLAPQFEFQGNCVCPEGEVKQGDTCQIPVNVELAGDFSDATQGKPYEVHALTASGGKPPYSFGIAGLLPPGLQSTIVGGDRLAITGTPTRPGPYDFNVAAIDADGNQSPSSAQRIDVFAPACLPDMWVPANSATGACECKPGLEPVPLGEGNGCRSPVEAVVETEICSPPQFKFQNACECPEGLIKNGTSCDQPVYVTLTGSLPDGTQGTPYRAESVVASGGNAPYTIDVTGDLPPGLEPSVSGGDTLVLQGTPSTPGDFDITAIATDSGGNKSNEQSLSIEIASVTCLPGMWVPSGGGASCQCKPGLEPVPAGQGSGCRAPQVATGPVCGEGEKQFGEGGECVPIDPVVVAPSVKPTVVEPPKQTSSSTPAPSLLACDKGYRRVGSRSEGLRYVQYRTKGKGSNQIHCVAGGIELQCSKGWEKVSSSKKAARYVRSETKGRGKGRIYCVSGGIKKAPQPSCQRGWLKVNSVNEARQYNQIQTKGKGRNAFYCVRGKTKKSAPPPTGNSGNNGGNNGRAAACLIVALACAADGLPFNDRNCSCGTRRQVDPPRQTQQPSRENICRRDCQGSDDFNYCMNNCING